jgi:hypothetical protein
MSMTNNNNDWAPKHIKLRIQAPSKMKQLNKASTGINRFIPTTLFLNTMTIKDMTLNVYVIEDERAAVCCNDS